MNTTEHKQKVMASFDMASEGYDCPGLRFFVESASWLVESMQFRGNEMMIDIATGTGNVAIAAARELSKGKVIGIDLSAKMLQKAMQKSAKTGLQNVTFQQCDIEKMDFGAHTFDAATCAFGLFFLPDMENGLRCIGRVLKPGGRLAVTSFTESLMTPLRGMLLDGIKKYGVEPPQLSWMRIDTPDKLNETLSSAGFVDIQIRSRQMGYYLKDGREWRDVLWNSGHRGLLNQLSPEDLERFLSEHLKEVEGLADEKGIWLEVEVLLATAAVRK